MDVIVNSSNPQLDLSQGRASSALLAAAGSRIQRECTQKYPRGVRGGEIAVTTGGNLNCAAIYHAVLTRYSSRKDENVIHLNFIFIVIFICRKNLFERWFLERVN